MACVPSRAGKNIFPTYPLKSLANILIIARYGVRSSILLVTRAPTVDEAGGDVLRQRDVCHGPAKTPGHVFHFQGLQVQI